MSTYSFNDVVASIVGPTGGAPFGYGSAVADEGITIAMAGDKNTMTVGADGHVMHSLHADRSGHVTVRLLKISPINAVLQAMYDTQTMSAELHGNNTITVAHATSHDMTVCSACAFKKKPDIKYSKDGDILEWQFDSGRIDTVLGSY